MMTTKKPKRPRRIMTPVYLDAPQKAAIAELSRRTRVTQAEYVREAINDLLVKYAKVLRGAK